MTSHKRRWVVLETSNGNTIWTEQLSDGTFTWQANPGDLKRPEQNAKVILSSSCQGKDIRVKDVFRFHRSFVNNPDSLTCQEQYADSIYSVASGAALHDGSAGKILDTHYTMEYMANKLLELKILRLNGESLSLTLQEDATLRSLKARIEEKSGIPVYNQKLLHNDIVLEAHKNEHMLVEFGIEPGATLTLGACMTGWVWADELGEPSVEKRGGEYWKIGEATTTYRSQNQLEEILDWVENNHGEDSDVEELGNGIVKVLGAFPETPEDVLAFLLGRDGEKPVIPWLDLDKENVEEEDWERVPWRDIQYLAVSRMPEVLPRYGPGYNSGRGPIPDDYQEAATRALVCAGPAATESEVEAMGEMCTFYTLPGLGGENPILGPANGIKPDAKDYFSLTKESQYGERSDPMTPYLLICANPVKQTIAFVYQCTFWI